MAGKSIKKVFKNSSRGNRKLRRSLRFGVGRYKGIIKSIEFTTTKSKKEAIKILIYNPDTEMNSTYLIVLESARGEVLIDTLLDICDTDEATPEDLVGLEIGFETELSDSYINLKSFYEVDNEFEEEVDEDIEEELDEDEEYYDEDLED